MRILFFLLLSFKYLYAQTNQYGLNMQKWDSVVINNRYTTDNHSISILENSIKTKHKEFLKQCYADTIIKVTKNTKSILIIESVFGSYKYVDKINIFLFQDDCVINKTFEYKWQNWYQISESEYYCLKEKTINSFFDYQTNFLGNIDYKITIAYFKNNISRSRIVNRPTEEQIQMLNTITSPCD